MIDFKNSPTRAEALRAMLAEYRPNRRCEPVNLSEAIGRIPAQTLYSRNTLPVARASMGDGIAVSSACFRNGSPDTSRWELGREYVRADTGDDFDDRYDAVIMIENVTFDESGKLSLKNNLEVKPGTGIRKRGSLIKEGDFLIPGGVPIRPCDLAALAVGGITEVPVYKKPVVAFIPTGSELVPAGAQPQRGQTVDANSIMAEYTLLEMGAEPLLYPIVKDNPPALMSALEAALQKADIVVMNGGSSKGEEDFTPRVFKEMGKIFFHGIAAAPGRPLCLALIGGKPVINLPGPVLAAYYGLDWCIRAFVNHYLELPPLQRPKVTAVLTEDMSAPSSMDFLCKINLKKDSNGTYLATPLPFKTMSLGVCMSSNGLFISKIGEGDYKKGTVIQVELLRGAEFI